ncbi:hypothetical protein LTR56_000479 [Elasticomyces elasticus]|nr:hypothetical protein LTR22_014207 [Elasticomyces elasticus]KAK3660721.1 hypothetical protein LTR56_000479 [Elasticomyces elasticus]KAK4922867.1 hypothetical protein LTR49_009874 [Elasticomyces elasticus]KAK5759757.1 hypothetical protein LTS12_010097 [Elasticomyces elasticus]
MAEQLVTDVAEQLVTELLDRVHEADRTIVSLKLEAHANQMQLKAAKDEAAAVQHQYLKLLGTQTVELIKTADKVAELEKTIEDMQTQEPSNLATEVAEVKEMLQTALDLKTMPKPELPTTVLEEPEEDVAPYDCFDDPESRAKNASSVRTTAPDAGFHATDGRCELRYWSWDRAKDGMATASKRLVYFQAPAGIIVGAREVSGRRYRLASLTLLEYYGRWVGARITA